MSRSKQRPTRHQTAARYEKLLQLVVRAERVASEMVAVAGHDSNVGEALTLRDLLDSLARAAAGAREQNGESGDYAMPQFALRVLEEGVEEMEGTLSRTKALRAWERRR